MSKTEVAAIVAGAVRHAIEAYEHALYAHDIDAHEAAAPPVVTTAPETAEPTTAMPVQELERLTHEMGLDDMAFVEQEAPQPEVIPEKTLAADMGVTDFLFGDARDARPLSAEDRASARWLADQLERPSRPPQEPQEPVRHAADVLRDGLAHLSAFVHHHKPDTGDAPHAAVIDDIVTKHSE